MRDPRDQESGLPPDEDEQARALEQDDGSASAPSGDGEAAPGSAETERALLIGGPGRPALNDEIARRWDPTRLVRMVSRDAGSGAPLDAMTRARYERRFGVDLGGVRVYTGELAEKVTTQHSAEAVTVGGTGMIFMSGTPDRSPATSSGRSLLAHELTHVAQSARGLYRSAPGESAPLATAEHEAEAEAVEAEEEAASGGLMDPGDVDPEKAAENLVEAVTARVLDLIYEDERVHELRSGGTPMRP